MENAKSRQPGEIHTNCDNCYSLNPCSTNGGFDQYFAFPLMKVDTQTNSQQNLISKVMDDRSINNNRGNTQISPSHNSRSFTQCKIKNEKISVIVQTTENKNESYAKLISTTNSGNRTTDISLGTVYNNSSEDILPEQGVSQSPAYATLTPLMPLPPISTMSDKFSYSANINVCDRIDNINTIESDIAEGGIVLKCHYNNQQIIQSQNSAHNTHVQLESLSPKASGRHSSSLESFNLTSVSFDAANCTSSIANITFADHSSHTLHRYSSDINCKSEALNDINDLRSQNLTYHVSPDSAKECNISINDGINLPSNLSSFGDNAESGSLSAPSNVQSLLTSKAIFNQQTENDNYKRNTYRTTDTLDLSNQEENEEFQKMLPRQIEVKSNIDGVKQRESEGSGIQFMRTSQKRSQMLILKSSNKSHITSGVNSKGNPVIQSDQTDITQCTRDRVIFSTYTDMDEINTKDLSQCISSELKRYSIPQAIFAQRVLCRSQGTLSDLLRNPKPWSKLKSGRETFRRMLKWLQEPEYQRMSVLRVLTPQSRATKSSSNTFGNEVIIGKSLYCYHEILT